MKMLHVNAGLPVGVLNREMLLIGRQEASWKPLYSSVNYYDKLTPQIWVLQEKNLISCWLPLAHIT